MQYPVTIWATNQLRQAKTIVQDPIHHILDLIRMQNKLEALWTL